MEAARLELERRRDTGRQLWTQDDITLAQWLDHWLDAVLPMTARWKTLSTYRSQMRRHVIPALGAWRLTELRPEHFEEHYRRMQTDGHSTHVIRAVHRVLRSDRLPKTKGSKGARRVRRRKVQASQDRRAVFQPVQAGASTGHPLRQVRHDLLRRRPP